MTDEELINQIAKLSALAPKPENYMRSSSVSKGHGKRTQTTQTQEIDQDAFDKAKTDFANSPPGKQLAALQGELNDRRDYSKSPLGSIAGPLSFTGEIPGGVAATLTTPKGIAAPAGTTRLGRAATAVPYAIRAVPAGIAAYLAEREALDPSNPPWKRDTAQGVATGMMGYASYPTVVGAINSLSTIGAGSKSNTPPPPDDGSPPPSLTLQKGDTPTTTYKKVADYLNVPYTDKDLLRDIAPRVRAAAANAPDSVITGLASSARPAIAGGSRADVLSWLEKTAAPGAKRLPMLPFVGTAIGAYGLANNPENAWAGSPRKDESATDYNLRRLGDLDRTFGLQGAAETGDALANALKAAGSYITTPDSVMPSASPTPPPSRRTNSDIPALPSEVQDSDIGSQMRMERDAKVSQLQQARAEDARQRRDLTPHNTAMDPDISDAIKQDAARRPEMSQAMVDRGTPPEKALPPYFDDLPKYEQDLVRSGKDPRAIASMLLPLVRAGVEEGNEGGDFHGGTPRYNRKLSALQQFYGGSGTAPLLAAANADADKAIASGPPASKPKAPKVASPTSAPASPPPPPMQDDDTTPPPPPLYAMGGSVRHILRRYVH